MQAETNTPGRPDLVGKKVRAKNGKKLGKVIHCFDDCFTIERGFFAPEDFAVSYDEVFALENGEVILKRDKHELERATPSEVWIEGESPPGNTLLLDLEGGQRRAEG